MGKSIFLNKKTFQISEGVIPPNDQNYSLIISNKEIEDGLPEIIRHENVIDSVQKIILFAFNRLSSFDLPLQGFGKINLGLTLKPENYPSLILEKTKKFITGKLSDEDLSVRLYNCLKNNIEPCAKYMYQVIIYHDEDILKFRNLGKNSLKEFEEVLKINCVTDQLRDTLRKKSDMLYNIQIKNIVELDNNPNLIYLIDLIKDFKDLKNMTLEDFLYKGVISGMFPFRHTVSKEIELTEAEKKFSKDEQQKIHLLSKKVIEVAELYYHSTMEKYILDL